MAYCLDYLALKSDKIENPDAYMTTMLRSFLLGNSIAGGKISQKWD